jgi:hypothetical protein
MYSPTQQFILRNTDFPEGESMVSKDTFSGMYGGGLSTTADYVSSGSDRAEFADKTIFTGTPHTVGAMIQGEQGTDAEGGRNYVHHYRVPTSSISPEIYADDDAYRTPTLSSGATPTLWESIPLRRSQVHKMQKVVQMRNNVEGPGEISHVIPKEHMGKLGIQFVGTSATADWNKRYGSQSTEPSSDNPVSGTGDVRKSVTVSDNQEEPRRKELPGQLQLDI